MRAFAVSLLTALAFASCVAQSILPADPSVRRDPVLAGTLKVRLTQTAMRNELPNTLLSELGLTLVRPLLKFEQSVRWQRNKHRDRLQSSTNDEALFRYEDELLRTFIVTYSNTAIAPERMCAWLRPGCSAVEIAEPFVVSHITAEPDDPQRTDQAMLALINVYEAWDIEEGSDTVLIGISDTGVLQTHEDLKDALFINSGEIPNNNIDDDSDGYVDNYNGYNFCTLDDGTAPGDTYNSREGHGTGVAGICGAVVNNGVGIAGVANKCKLVPLKTMPNTIGGIVYGYESMIYCAVTGVDIINCSWGSQSRSCIDESVVQYAIARGVAVVAAAGNHATAAPFFPAAYKGVLGVGVTDAGDNVIGMSAVGPTVDIMAPGQGTRTTSNDGTYGGFCCTSGAAPIVSGVLGLIRSKYPTLTPLQACAIAREAVTQSPWVSIPDDKTPALLPLGRLNARTSVSVRPDSVPSVEIDTVVVSATSDDTRWTVGDTLLASIVVRNVLATWTPTTVSIDLAPFSPLLSVGVVPAGAAQTPEGIVLTSGETYSVLVPLLVTRDTDTSSFIRMRMQSGAGATTQVLAAITPSPAFRILRNDVLTLSVGDNARIGNVDIDRAQGTGLLYRGYCGQLYEGGLMVGAGGRVVSAVRAVRGIDDHFLPVKRFTRPDPLRGIVRDDKAPDSLRLGIEVQQVVHIASGDTGVFVSDITLKNVSDSTLRDVAAAWFLDWDLGNQPVQNRTELVEYNTAEHRGVQGVWSTSAGAPYVACATMSVHSDAAPICAGINNATTYDGFSVSEKDSLMRSGASIQHASQADIAVVSGMRFTSAIPSGGVRTFRMVWSIDLDDVADLETVLPLLKNFPEIETLSISNKRFTDAGSAHLAELPNLQDLNLYQSNIGDEGLKHLTGLKNLRRIPMGETRVTDKGLKIISGMTELEYIGVRGNDVTDAGVAHLKDLTSLRGLYLGQTKITDDGLKHLASLTRLRDLYLHTTGITDAGLEHLTGLKDLRDLYLAKTKTTEDGHAKLKLALPDVDIDVMFPR